MRRRLLRTILASLAVIALLSAVGVVRQSLRGDEGDVVMVEPGSAGYDRAGGDFSADDAGVSPSLRSGSGVNVGGGVSGGGGSGGRGVADSAAPIPESAISEEEFAPAADEFTDGSSSTIPLPPLSANDRIIKDGRVEIEIPKGGFDRAFAQIVALAGKVGGQVLESQSSRQEDRSSGEVTIRVPAQRFEELLASTGGIGKIQHRSVTSQDVSGEFVDLQSRLRHLQAQERFYLELLGKAKVVGDAIAINQHLSSVQAEMEQIQGRLRLLDDRTTYSRLTISIYEPGVVPLLSEIPPGARGVLAQAWSDALTALQETIGALLIGAFTLAPLALLGLIGWALWRRLRPRPAPRRDPEPAEQEHEGPLPVG